MKIKSAIQAAAVALLAAACATAPTAPLEINSLAFEKRVPLPGQPGYLETIKYIDDGMKSIDPSSEFFVSYDGDMCFRGLVNRQLATFETYTNYWCMNPQVVNNVDLLRDNITNINAVRLWCVHAAPQCARRLGYPNYLDTSPGIANSIWVEITPYQPERAALEHLVYLMGGSVRQAGALR
jgi:hypothetical protein